MKLETFHHLSCWEQTTQNDKQLHNRTLENLPSITPLVQANVWTCEGRIHWFYRSKIVRFYRFWNAPSRSLGWCEQSVSAGAEKTFCRLQTLVAVSPVLLMTGLTPVLSHPMATRGLNWFYRFQGPHISPYNMGLQIASRADVVVLWQPGSCLHR